MDVLIAIEGCEAHRDRFNAQWGTWAKNCMTTFFTGPELGVADDYDSLPAKTQAICRWAREYDFLFKCDTDTYASIVRLLASGFEQYDYSGFVRDDGFKPEYCYGPAYWLSKKAMNILADADWAAYPSVYPTCEDVMVGAILNAHGITPHHDPRYALYHDVLPENDIITSHLSHAGRKFQIEFMYDAHRKANGG